MFEEKIRTILFRRWYQMRLYPEQQNQVFHPKRFCRFHTPLLWADSSLRFYTGKDNSRFCRPRVYLWYRQCKSSHKTSEICSHSKNIQWCYLQVQVDLFLFLNFISFYFLFFLPGEHVFCYCCCVLSTAVYFSSPTIKTAITLFSA